MLSDLKKRVVGLKNKLLNCLYILFGFYNYNKNNHKKSLKNFNIGVVVEEFFHYDLRGFGGFGKTVKNLSEYFNPNGRFFKIKVIIPQGLPVVATSQIKIFHNTEVLLRSKVDGNSLFNSLNYLKLIHQLKLRLFITIDYYKTYENVLLASPFTPILIWIRDPRSAFEWYKLGTVNLELKQRNKKNIEELKDIAYERANSLKKIVGHSKKIKRKLIFATNGNFLIERAKKAYEINDINPYYLPNPVPLPTINTFKYSQKPSLLFLARLDAQKRYWIVFELAKRFKEIDFYICGVANNEKLSLPIIQQYAGLHNLKFIGHVDGSKKNEYLSSSWGLINTSVHEGLPVSFLEAFSFGKPVISCQNPDGLVERFGFYTGEVLGEGLDERSLDLFSHKIEEFLKREDERKEKGVRAKKYVEENHCFSNFDNSLMKILSKEGII